MRDRVELQRFPIALAVRSGNGYLNPSLSSFAVLPEVGLASGNNLEDLTEDGYDTYSVPNKMAAEIVLEFQRICTDGGKRQDKLDFLKPIFHLWSEGQVLFPLGFMWGQSALGALDPNLCVWLGDQTGELQEQTRSAIQAFPVIQGLSPKRGTNSASAIYKLALAFQLSSTHIRSLFDIRDEHLDAFADVTRPDGHWASWVSKWSIISARYLVRGLSEARNEPNLGRSISRVHYTRNHRSELIAGTPTLQWISELFEKYIDDRKLIQRKSHRRALSLLLKGLAKCPAETLVNERTAFSRANMQVVLDTAKAWSTPETRLQAVAKILDFGSWVEDRSRDDNGLPQLAIGLTNRDLERFRAALPVISRSSDSEVSARPMPARFHAELKKIITENDFAWPKSIKVHDRPFHWITYVDPTTGRGEPVFCEVIPRILLLMLDLPLRGVQVRRLDSGEGDDEAWDPRTGLWGPNSSPHAGYWRRTGAKNSRRGVLRRISSAGRDGSSITGFYINSNKTQDRSKSFDETSGYEIPWEFDDVIQNLAAMRAWQERYNPVNGPLGSKDTPVQLRSEEASASIADIIPDRFYLFRYPLNPGVRGKEAPPSYRAVLQFFYLALDELERRLNLDDPENPITIITRREPSGSPRHAIFTIHGMRSSTISTLYTEGVPIAILSKLVAGHATILMTLSYVKYDPVHVSEILTAARQKALTEDAAHFRKTLRDASFQEAARMTARLLDDGLQQSKGLYAESSAWSGMDIGICPNGGTLCHVGGEPTSRRSSHSGRNTKFAYLPVPGGARNCVRCRFFITGLPFLIPLWGHANMLSARASSLSARIEQRESQLKGLKRERHELSSVGEPIPDDLRRRIMTLEAEWDADVNARDQAFSNFHATLTYIEKVRAISRVEGDGKLPMLLPTDGVPEVTGRESTRFELSDHVVQMSRFFPSLESAELERERDQFLDKILYNGGYVPITLGPLGADDRRRASDALAAFLIGELGAAEAQNLIEGRKTLADLGLQDAIEEVARRSVGAPLTRLEMRPRPATVLELTVTE